MRHRLAHLIVLATLLSVAARGRAQDAVGATELDGPVVALGARGLSVTSADGRYAVGLGGLAQVSGRFYVGDEDELGTDGLLTRRMRPSLTLRADDLSLRMTLETASGVSLLDAYVDWAPLPEARLRVGQFKTPFGLELGQSAPALQFLERALPSAIVPGRDLGVAFYGVAGEGLLEYHVGLFNGVVDGTNGGRNLDDHVDVGARLFVRPLIASPVAALAGFGVGVGLTWGEEEGSDGNPALPVYATAGRRAFFRYIEGTLAGTAVADGQRMRLDGQAYYHVGGFQLFGEYVITWQDVSVPAGTEELSHSAWFAGSSYVIGGDIDLGGVRAAHPVGDGGLGALEIKARVGQMTLDEDAFPTAATPTFSTSTAQRATEVAGGLTWWLSPNARLLVDFFHTGFEAPGTATAPPDEDVVIGTVQFRL